MGLDTTVQLVPNQNSLLSSWGLSPLFEEKRLPADSLNVNLLEWKTQATVPVQAPSFIGPTTFQLVSLRNVKAADETVSGGSKTRVLVLRLSDGSTTHSAIEMDPFLPVDQLMIGTKIEVRRATVIGPYMLLEKAHTTVKGGYIYDDPVVASAAVSAGIVNRMYTPLQKGPPAYVSWEQRKKSPKTVKDADQRQLVGELMLGSQAAMAAPSRNITLEGKTSVAAKVSSDKITQALPRPRKERKQPDPTFWDDAPPERGPQDRASPLTFLSMLPQEILDVSTVFGGAEVVEEVIEVVEEVMRTATKTAVPDLKVEVAEEVMTTAIKTAADLKVEEVIEVAEEVMTTAIKTAVPDLKVEEVIEVAEEVMTTAIKTAVPDLKVEEAEAVKAVMATAIKIKRSTIREVDQATQPAEVLPKVRYQRELSDVVFIQTLN
ncbi:MAG: uncharacterized protein KVP18_002333 [Porospora cf. gigantea A]|uniref:uncharacterized protein n=1 Tax=Porospora cf. gigantea A TaxID=2853593 RepID=UPI0035599506|nr:MAG: hypothetical protein KVP18_002333 [Porospora cf. gigantea A]